MDKKAVVWKKPGNSTFLCIVGNNAALYQCGKLHCPINHMRIKKLGDDSIL